MLVRALEERVRVNGEHASQRYNDLKAALEGAKENAAAEISRLNRMLITEQRRNYNLQEALSRARATAALAVEKANRACRGLREKRQQVEELWARLAAVEEKMCTSVLYQYHRSFVGFGVSTDSEDGDSAL
ncbi:hypothetical protein H4Q26_006023 [Puccinia striiformis f. sp. tritici PST-130]|nr:hypothetical protein H4Q26_006023 [Puccinia striiformis f. sp. tritici PST-130]